MKKLLFCLVPLLLLAASTSGQEEKKPRAYMVSNAHLDTQWLWSVRTTIDDYLYRTLTQNFWLIDHYPDYVFNFEGGIKYSWIKEYYPAEYARLTEYIKAGRWNVSGSTWDANDTNIPSPESFFRNILLGQRFFKEEFGIRGNDLFLPDCFGFSYTLPTIAVHSGLIGFSTQKLQHRKLPFYNDDKLPFLYGIWEGIDGSELLSVAHAGDYITRYNYEDISHNGKLLESARNDINGMIYQYYGVGDRGGSPLPPSVESVERGVNGDGPVEIISARSGQMFEDLYPYAANPEMPRFKGELLMDVHGPATYTSQSAMKLFNRRNELLADAAERASVAAEWLGGLEYPAGELRTSWERFLWHQFHDDLTGTSIPEVYKYSWNDELISQSEFAEQLTTAVGTVSRALDTRTRGTALVVYNPVAQSRKDIVLATVDMPERPRGVTVTTPEGKTLPAQLVEWSEGRATVAFAADMAPVGFAIYDVRSGNTSSGKKVTAEGNVLENSIYKVTLDPNGDISSIIDKRNGGRELVMEGKSFRLGLFTENESTTWPAWELFKKTIDAKPVPISGNVKITVAEAGPLRATLRVERTFGESRFVQYISLTEGAADDRIDITSEIDWNERNSLLKAEFPMSVANENARYDLGMGFIRRGNNRTEAYEVPAQQWADITSPDNSYGVSIMNDCKYGWDKPDDNTLRLTLLHTPKVGRDPNMKHQEDMDIGHHTIRYAIYGHAADTSEGGTAHKAEAFNQPLVAFTAPKHAGKLGRKFSLVSSSLPQISIKAVKKAEDGSSYVVRVNEIYGKDFENGEIVFAGEIESAKELNAIEEVKGDVRIEGNKIVFSGKAFAPRTFGVKLKDNPVLSTPVSHPVALPLDATAVTVDAFNKAGSFDRQGNSFSAELLPSFIEAEGIRFEINNRPNGYNYIRSAGQQITLPEGHGADKLYLLVTSSQGDRQATFTLDGKEYAFEIPYYSGFYGQWGWKGYSEGYLKKASIAWVGTHRHSAREGNESYTYTYLYKISIPIEKEAGTLTLPDDSAVAVFAATLATNPNDEVKPAAEMRAVPYETAKEGL